MLEFIITLDLCFSSFGFCQDIFHISFLLQNWIKKYPLDLICEVELSVYLMVTAVPYQDFKYLSFLLLPPAYMER